MADFSKANADGLLRVYLTEPEGCICPACGKELKLMCPTCNQPMVSQARFCSNCGAEKV